MSSAGDATITTGANGRIWFYATSSPDNAAFVTDAGGLVDFSSTSGRNRDGAITAGSIAGLGNYYLGTNQLTVGGNNQSTVVGGQIDDGPPTTATVPRWSTPATAPRWSRSARVR